MPMTDEQKREWAARVADELSYYDPVEDRAIDAAVGIIEAVAPLIRRAALEEAAEAAERRAGMVDKLLSEHDGLVAGIAKDAIQMAAHDIRALIDAEGSDA